MTWRPTGVALNGFAPGAMRGVEIAGRPVLLARVGPLVYATSGECPHALGTLAEGTLAGRRVTCPVHGAVYDVQSGAVLGDPDGIVPPEGGTSPLRSYPTRVTDGVIEVDLGD